MIFYTYLWLREDGTPYYVGKGSGKRAYRKGCPTVEVIAGFIDEPAMDRIILQGHASESDAFFAEKFFIALYGRKDLGTGCLRNLTDGGDGVSGYKATEERKLQIAEAMVGNTYNLGRRPSKSTRDKMKNSHLGQARPKSITTRERLSKSMEGNKNALGYRHTEKTKASIRATLLAKRAVA
jgi:hypothetical protein